MRLVLAMGLAIVGPATLVAAEPPPNVVLILADNLGYGDLGCYGSTRHRTPHIDRLAREGVRFTACYAASGVCTPSRAALMTGCYPRRVNMHQSDLGGPVLQPVARRGLHPDETTVAEVLHQAGYATACIGKWHLGDQPEFLPTRQGFDEFLGIPYSDDMTPRAGQPWPALPLMRGEAVIEAPVDVNLLTRRYTDAAIEFLRRNADRPFFLYLPHATPGSTRSAPASAAFRGTSAHGAWGDSTEELDWSTGEILRVLEELGLDRKTLVLFASDNGAPRRTPPQGSNAPLRGWGYTTDEGGMRVPFLARWTGTIPAGRVCDELATLMDVYPTLAGLAGAAKPDRTIRDGRDLWPLLSDKAGAKTPHEAFYYYQVAQLQAVRDARWKLYLPIDRQATPDSPAVPGAAGLFDLRDDPRETKNVAGENPDIVARLSALAEEARRDLGDGEKPGRNQRPAGHVETAAPRAVSSRPNLLVILADDLGRGDYSAFGTKDLRTPHIDRLVREGMAWENFCANSPVCSPTRAALLTGCYPDRVGVPGVVRDVPANSWGWLSPRAVFLPQRLKEGGYRSAIVGKWHLGYAVPNTPLDRGFDHFHGFLGDMMDDYWTHRRNGKNFLRLGREEIDPEGHATDLFTDWACDFLRTQSGRADTADGAETPPFFLYLAYNAPHDPIQPPAEWLETVQAREPGISAKRAKLVALIEHMDAGIGRVLDTLDETGLAKDTLVVFTSDNGGVLEGEARNGPWRSGKQHMYEGGLRVPFVARWPGRIAAGSTAAHLGATMDLFPTLLEAASLSPSEGTDGVSLLPALRGGAGPPADRELYFVRREGGPAYGGKTIEAVRRGDWKLVHNSPFAPAELYHLGRDPRETANVAAQEPKVLRELSAALRRHIQNGGATPWQPPEYRAE